MKKYLLITAICAAAMVGCTNNVETPELTEIGYSPLSYSSVASKAIIDNAYYSTTDPDFGLFAYYLASGNNWATNGASANEYIKPTATLPANYTGASVEYSDGIWKSTPKSYWPLAGTLTFIAYSPKDANAKYLIGAGTGTLKVEGFTVAAAAGSQTDLLYSKSQECADKGKTNVTGYSSENGSTGKSGVPIMFRHSLTQIIVKAQDVTADENLRFKVLSVKLKALKDNADLTVVKTFGSEAADVVSWSNYVSSTAEQTIYSGTPANYLGTTSFEQIGEPVLVIPQTLLDNTQYLEVVYSQTTISNGNVTDNSATPKEIYLKKTALPSFDVNKKIVLNLSISADEIVYNPSVADWDTETQIPY